MPAVCALGLPMADQDRTRWLRENLPVVASVVDEFAAEFGRESIKVVYAKEAGHEFGNPGPDGVNLADIHLGPMSLKKESGR